MTRMIERWFPCKEVSEASSSGWGSGNSEKNLFSWFAGRPIAQAKAAVLTSLLPWPDDAEAQRSLQELVRRAMMSRDGAWDEVVAELGRAYPDGASLADPFSGRALIPLEAARLGVKAYGIDYSLVATLAGSLLADYPLRDWSSEPDLPFGDASLDVKRLVQDVQRVLASHLGYDVKLLLAPGRQRIAFAVRDDVARVSASVIQELDVDKKGTVSAVSAAPAGAR